MILKNVLQKGIEILRNCDNEAPALEAGVIFAYTLKKDKLYIYTHGEDEISDTEIKAYFELIQQRVKGSPLQYITKHQEFMSLDFTVGQGVLIPRNDTETLVEVVIAEAAKMNKQKLQILDIGTGSGCIAICLAHYISNCFVTAVDISPKALELAHINAGQLKVNEKIKFVKSNLFEEVIGNFDIIVSNPPYIESNVINSLDTEVKDYEPLIALDGGEDGLDFYRQIIKKAPDFLTPGSLLALEIGYTQAKVVNKLMDVDFKDIVILKDLSQNDRVVMGYLL